MNFPKARKELPVRVIPGIGDWLRKMKERHQKRINKSVKLLKTSIFAKIMRESF
jgi:hypothetical protein